MLARVILVFAMAGSSNHAFAGPEPETPLKGPSVTASAQKPTLVAHDFAGRLIRLEESPAEAAVRMMSLDPGTRERVNRIVGERAKLLDSLVVENLELLVKLQGARESGDRRAVSELTQDVMRATAPLRQRGPIMQELLGALDAEQGAELTRLVREYWDAAVEDRVKHKEEGGMTGPEVAPGRRERAGRGDRGAALRAEMSAVAQGEVRRAYERTILADSRDFDALLRELGVTPEQESRIRKIVGDRFIETYGKLTPQDRASIFWKVYSELDPDQRRAALERLGARQAGGSQRPRGR